MRSIPLRIGNFHATIFPKLWICSAARLMGGFRSWIIPKPGAQSSLSRLFLPVLLFSFVHSPTLLVSELAANWLVPTHPSSPKPGRQPPPAEHQASSMSLMTYSPPWCRLLLDLSTRGNTSGTWESLRIICSTQILVTMTSMYFNIYSVQAKGSFRGTSPNQESQRSLPQKVPLK